MKGKWATPVFLSILVIGLLYSVDTQIADADSVCNAFSNSGCNDGDACTDDDCVLSGVVPNIHAHCSNIPTTGNTCNDGNACTTGDTCQSGTCTGGANVANGASCTDANACNGDETCQSGVCTAGTQLNCNDDNACTDDSCVPASGCANDPVADGTTCGNPGDGRCDLQDTCDGLGAWIDEIEPEGDVCGIPAPDVNQFCDDTGICVPSSALVCEELDDDDDDDDDDNDDDDD